MHHRPARVPAPRSTFAGFRFPPEVITLAVRWYLRFGLSYRDVEELLAERGIEVDHVSVYRWVQRFTPLLIDAARPCRHATGDRWFVDETYIKVAGRWVYLYRAIDQYGQVIDVLVSEKRDLAATRRFFTQALEHRLRPTEVSTDRASTYPRVSRAPPAWLHRSPSAASRLRTRSIPPQLGRTATATRWHRATATSNPRQPRGPVRPGPSWVVPDLVSWMMVAWLGR
jgi:transposase-like protein